jgi:hypothetical protein
MLGRWTAELAERPEANAAKSAREQLTLIRVFEEFRGHGYDTPTMLYGGTPNDGPRIADKRQLRPTYR